MSASDVALFVVQACIQFYDNVYADACVSVFSECFLIGNYAMLIRHSWINVDGMDCSIGIPVTCVLIVFTVIAGFIRFKRFDIIQEEN